MLVSAQPVIFISAVGSELKSARDLCGRLLNCFGYRVTWQEHSSASEKDALFLLRPKIEYVDAVFALVGKQYGPEPKEPPENFGRLSYAQYEVKFAQSINQPVYFIRCDKYSEATPLEPAEAPALVALQEKYVADLHTQALLLRTAANPAALEMAVGRLRAELPPLAANWPMRMAASIVAGALALGGWWMWDHRSQVIPEDPRDGLLLAAVRQFPQLETGLKSERPPREAGDTRAQAYAQLGKNLGVDHGLLKSLVMFASTLQKNPEKPVLDRARAAYTAGDYPQAEELYLAAARAAQTASPARLAEAVDALELAGWSARERMAFARAMEHFRGAAAQTSQKRDALQWARIQHAIAFVLADQGKPAEAEPILKKVAAERDRLLGPNNVESLGTKNNLSNSHLDQGDFNLAEEEMRGLYLTQRRTLGAEHLLTLTSRHNLSIIQLSKGQAAEAECSQRAVLAARLRLLGPDHADTLATRTALAMSLQSQAKYAEAEKELELALAIYLRTLGPEHVDTLVARHTLGGVLLNFNKAPAGEKELREVIALRHRVLGPEHRDTVSSRNSLVMALLVQGKYADAEKEVREVIEIRGRILGKNHSSTLASCNNLAEALIEQGRFAEAEPEARHSYLGLLKALGADHPNTLDAAWNLARALGGQQKMTEASEFARRAADGARRVLTIDHPKAKLYQQYQNEIRSTAAALR